MITKWLLSAGTSCLSLASAPSPRSRGLARRLQSLIANLELEFLVNPRKQTSRAISNRKFLAIFHAAPGSRFYRLLVHPSSTQPLARSLKILTGTLRLELAATHTKQSPEPISNRDKTGSSAQFSAPESPLRRLLAKSGIIKEGMRTNRLRRRLQQDSVTA